MQSAVLNAPSNIVKIMLCGVLQEVTSTIHLLHKAGFVQISACHQPQPIANSSTHRLISQVSNRLQRC